MRTTSSSASLNTSRRFTRRRFLSGLGLLAGGAALVPLLRGVRPRGARVEVTRKALGTWVRVVARHRDEAAAMGAVERAFAAVRRVDDQMSIHHDSELARVNRAAGSAAIAVSPAVLEVVARARAAAERTGGVYDPTILPIMRLYGFYGEPTGALPSDREIGLALARVGIGGVAIDRERGTMALERPGAGIDLGSIGKGWAVDRAADALREAGATDGLVDAGGNVYAFGVPEEGADGWSVGVLHPASHAIDRVFVLRDTAIATSGNAEQHRIVSGITVGHLFDARRGRPANGHLSSTVQARSATDADLMSTVSYLLGPDRFAWPEALATHFIG